MYNNPWNMNGGYYPPQQQMQPPPQPQWMASAQAQLPKAQAAQNQQARMQDRINTLQEQYKGAGSDQQAGMQERINSMQAKLKEQQGTATGADRENYGWRQERRQAKNAMAAGRDVAMAPQQKQPNAVQGGGQTWRDPMMMGGMGGGSWAQGPQQDWSTGRMQSAQPMPMGSPQYGQQGGASQYGGMRPQGPWGGMGMNGYGMDPYGSGMAQGQYQGGLAAASAQAQYGGGYYPQQQEMGGMTGANRPGMQYRQDRRQANKMPGGTPVAPQPQQGWNPGTQATGMGNMFDTGWGRLVASSTGNQNVMQLENDPSRLFHYDPNAQDGPGAKGGWKSMTPDEYRSYGDYNYADPRQFGAAANPMMQQWQKNANGMWAGKVGTGSYA